MYMLRKNNTYWKCREFVSKANAQRFNLDIAKELQIKLKKMCINVVIEAI